MRKRCRSCVPHRRQAVQPPHPQRPVIRWPAQVCANSANRPILQGFYSRSPCNTCASCYVFYSEQSSASRLELHAKRDVIQTLSRRYGARRIRVFGSVARREERADSDVDFLVDFPRGYDLFAQRIPLTDQLAQLLNRPVELIPEHELNRHIREQVLREVVEL